MNIENKDGLLAGADRGPNAMRDQEIKETRTAVHDSMLELLTHMKMEDQDHLSDPSLHYVIGVSLSSPLIQWHVEQLEDENPRKQIQNTLRQQTIHLLTLIIGLSDEEQELINRRSDTVIHLAAVFAETGLGSVARTIIRPEEIDIEKVTMLAGMCPLPDPRRPDLN